MRFSQIDVFTHELMLGNPVAVVHDADEVADDDMAAFARWTNLSETTFLLTPTDPVADYRLRIFTTHGELPFAGHPTLGSARAWLAAGGVPKQRGRLVQECGAGLVRVRDRDGRLAFAAPPLLRSGPVDEADVERLATGLGLSRSDVVDAQWGDNGPGWIILLLASAEAVLAVDASALGADEKVGIVGPRPEGSETDFEVRGFFPGGEDPVTGSLNASIAQWFIESGRAPGAYTAAQGTVLGRRGRVHVELDDDDDIWVGGDTVVGITGTVDL
jgi:PhzF family phenazine biosynthesis protein